MAIQTVIVDVKGIDRFHNIKSPSDIHNTEHSVFNCNNIISILYNAHVV